MGNSLRLVRVIADYQFGKGAGKALFPETCRFITSYSGRVRQVVDGVRIATVKADTGLLTISIEGARRLLGILPYPEMRVIVKREVSEFIAKGRSVFAKHVVDVDGDVRPNDEVIVINEDGELLATGRATLSAREMVEMKKGVAVSVRYGISKEVEE